VGEDRAETARELQLGACGGECEIGAAGADGQVGGQRARFGFGEIGGRACRGGARAALAGEREHLRDAHLHLVVAEDLGVFAHELQRGDGVGPGSGLGDACLRRRGPLGGGAQLGIGGADIGQVAVESESPGHQRRGQREQ